MVSGRISRPFGIVIGWRFNSGDGPVNLGAPEQHGPIARLFSVKVEIGREQPCASMNERMEFPMKAKIILLGAVVIALAPSPALAQLTPAPGNGQFNGNGYDHFNSGNALGQPGQSCQDLIELGLGATPGNSASAPGSGSPFDFSDTTSGSHYAGSAQQNARNSASVSQYDVACLNQAH
jgi:hypothetical protein